MLDVYPEEIDRHTRDLRRQGETVRGPFKDEKEALAVAVEMLRGQR